MAAEVVRREGSFRNHQAGLRPQAVRRRFRRPDHSGQADFYVAFEGTRPEGAARHVQRSRRDHPAEHRGSDQHLDLEDLQAAPLFRQAHLVRDDNDTVNLSGYKRNQSNLADFGGNAPPSMVTFCRPNRIAIRAQWRHTAGNFLNFVNVAYDKASQGTPNVTDGPEYILKSAQNTGSQDLVLMGATASSRTTPKNRGRSVTMPPSGWCPYD